MAVLGDGVLQEIVVTIGAYRWLDPSTAVHVQPGEIVDAGTFTVYEQGGLKGHGAHNVVWKGDAAQIAFSIGPWVRSTDTGSMLVQARASHRC